MTHFQAAKLLQDFKFIADDKKRLLSLWPIVFIIVITVLFFCDLESKSSRTPGKLNGTFLLFVFGAVIFAPLVENAILALLVRIGIRLRLGGVATSMAVGAISGVMHAQANNWINGVFATIFFYLMARIYASYRGTALQRPAFWFGVALHTLNNALVALLLALSIFLSDGA